MLTTTHYAAFERAVFDALGERCWFALHPEKAFVPGRGNLPDLPRAPICDGPLEACHLIPRRLVRDKFREGAWRYATKPVRWYATDSDTVLTGGFEECSSDQLVFDPRLGIPACRKHRELYESGIIRLREPPETLGEALRELGLPPQVAVFGSVEPDSSLQKFHSVDT